MKTHDTIVVGIDKDDNIIFFKSFDYSAQRNEAQEAFKYVSETFPTWYISGLNSDSWRLTAKEGQDFYFTIPNPIL